MNLSKLSIINLFITSVALMFNISLANSKTLKGKVFGIDENGEKKLLPSATILIEGTNRGTFTNAFGEFSIDVNPNQMIIVSFVGYKKQAVSVETGMSFVEITLEPELTSDEVIVQAKKPDQIVDKSSITKTEIITSSGLKKAACCNLSESFITNPTVDVTYSDAITGVKQIQLLGLAQNYTQIMLEMVPNFQGLASNYGLLFIPGPWMNSISISKGTSSVTRGYESITGQINIELKGAESEENLVFNNYLNNIFRFEGNIVLKKEITDNLVLTNFVHGNYFNKKVDHNGDGFLDLPTNKQINLLSRFDYNSETYESKTFIQALINNSKSGQVDFFDKPSSNGVWGSKVDIRRIGISTKNGFLIDKEESLSLGSIFSFVHHKQNSFFGKRTFNTEQNSIFATILWTSPFRFFDYEVDRLLKDDNGGNLILGLSYSYNNYLQYIGNIDVSKMESVPGFFAELTIEPLQEFQVIAGARVDFHNHAGKIFTPRFHLKYSPAENHTFRFSIGKGYHFPLPIVENQSILTSSREIIIENTLSMEQAWNLGLNYCHDFEILGRPFTLNLEYYYSKFITQTIVDRDISPNKIFIYDLKGKSYSNSFQIDIMVDLLSNLTAFFAYRLNDVWITTNEQFQRKALISPHKALLNIAYSPNPLSLDFTIEYNSGGRIPSTKSNPSEFRLSDSFEPFLIFYGQITFKIGKFEIYLGAENISDFRQPLPIVAYKNPFSEYFDGSMIWGPIEGRKIYIGTRYIY